MEKGQAKQAPFMLYKNKGSDKQDNYKHKMYFSKHIMFLCQKIETMKSPNNS